MPTFQRDLDVYQGFNFSKDRQSPVGYLHSIKIDDTSFEADITVSTPKDNSTENNEAVVAVLSSVHWGTGATDTISLTGHLSTKNKQELSTLLFKSLTKMNVEIKFDIREYDPLAKKYFVSLSSVGDAVLKCILEKNGTELSLTVADECSTQVQSPQNYFFAIGVKPETEEQPMQVATSSTKNVAKKWGVLAKD